MAEKLLVLTGSGRSGTTLMAQALNEAYSYGIGAEPKNVKDIIDYCRSCDLNKEQNYQEALKKCYNSQVLRRLRSVQKIETRFEDLVACVESRTCEGVVTGLFQYAANLRNRRLIGYKDPKDVTNLKYIKSNVPGAYFIHVIRNGEDVAYSVNKFDWGANNPVSGAIFWRRQIRKFLKDKISLPPEDYLEIKLEDFQKDLKGVSQNIDSFVAQHTSVSEFEKLYGYLQAEYRSSDKYKKKGLVYNMVRYIVRDCNRQLGYENLPPKGVNVLYELLIPFFFLYDIPFILYGRLRNKAQAN